MALKTFISPSDLTFGWSNCHRCLWLRYNEGVYAPMAMPLVGTLSALQEGFYARLGTHEMNPKLPRGHVVDAGGWVVSAPLTVAGRVTEFRLRGKYDLLVQFEDGAHGVIDCKVSGSESDKASFYAPQLEAYAFALENPESGDVRAVSHTGLLVWQPTGAGGSADEGYTFSVDSFWQPVARDPQRLAHLLADFIALISADQPPPSAGECRDCGYVAKRQSLGW